SIPSLTAANTRLVPIKGAPPNVTRAPTFCAFAPRCDHAEARCRQARPPLEAAGADQTVACWRWREVERGPRTGAGAADKPAVTAPKQEALLTVT
ncbi:oligopeptide/dipeptide ABC transporter ATP-binding protein, partial [Mesorhizobium sp. M00.F.Ca.ET.216.01.1.1]|uniref:oligopeptide/dipeptide ABC transporter ATP-binding protein n=1 Tax=Mesorhizobium sp. M00.F.Ca.ET.216.01.1.1 TaxID=2500528 RepID=UPI00113897D1